MPEDNISSKLTTVFCVNSVLEAFMIHSPPPLHRAECVL